MPITKTQTPRTREKSQQLEEGSATYLPAVLPSDDFPSPTVLFDKPEFSLSWDNDIKQHIASNLLHLRRYRGKSQAEVAAAIGTSQPAIAKIEAGEANFTADTVERIIEHLRGRFFVRIQPEEFGFQRRTPWWEGKLQAQIAGSWSVMFGGYRQMTTADSIVEQAVFGIERTTPRKSQFFISSGSTNNG